MVRCAVAQAVGRQDADPFLRGARSSSRQIGRRVDIGKGDGGIDGCSADDPSPATDRAIAALGQMPVERRRERRRASSPGSAPRRHERGMPRSGRPEAVAGTPGMSHPIVSTAAKPRACASASAALMPPSGPRSGAGRSGRVGRPGQSRPQTTISSVTRQQCGDRVIDQRATLQQCHRLVAAEAPRTAPGDDRSEDHAASSSQSERIFRFRTDASKKVIAQTISRFHSG